MDAENNKSRRNFIKNSVIAGTMLPFMPNDLFADVLKSPKVAGPLNVCVFSKHLQFLNYKDMEHQGYQKIDIPNLMETEAYFLQKDQSQTNEFHQYHVKFLINGFWINLSSSFGKSIEDGAGWIQAAVDSL